MTDTNNFLALLIATAVTVAWLCLAVAWRPKGKTPAMVITAMLMLNAPGIVWAGYFALLYFNPAPPERPQPGWEGRAVVQACESVCTNSDAYDPDMTLVRVCDKVLRTYSIPCFADAFIEAGEQ